MFENFNRWKYLVVGGLVVLAFITLNFRTFYQQKSKSIKTDNQDVFKYFGTEDGLDITWCHRANSKNRLQLALLDDTIKMIEADVILGKLNPEDEELQPVMGHQKEDLIDLSVSQFVDTVISQDKKKGIKLDFKDINAVEPTLKFLEAKQDKIQFPVWLNADTTLGPGGTEAKVDGERFVQLANKYCPSATLSLGFTYKSPSNTPLTQDMVKAMNNLARQTKMPVTFAINVAMFTSSITPVSWLIHQDPERFSITLWTSIVANHWEGADLKSVCEVRRQLSKKTLFYDLSIHKDTWLEFINLCGRV